MTEWCNGEFDTVDDMWKLMIECILQGSLRDMEIRTSEPDEKLKRKMQARYAEFLYLPLTIDERSRLCFSVGKLFHHQRMWTAWPIEPTSLMERLDNDDENNLIIESQAPNYYKFDYSPIYYPLLKRMIRRINIPKERADEDVKMGPYDKALEEELERERKRALVLYEEAKKMGKVKVSVVMTRRQRKAMKARYEDDLEDLELEKMETADLEMERMNKMEMEEMEHPGK